ncbi:hypothetical protein LCGC14_2904630, partial [marine sediment metagenome]
GDWLQNIFLRQRELMEKYDEIERMNGFHVPTPPVDLHDRRSQAYIRELIRRTVEELFESSHCLKNSAWKQSHILTDEDHFYEELADAFHFFIELCIAVGLDAEDLYTVYFKKSEVNKFRQRSAY